MNELIQGYAEIMKMVIDYLDPLAIPRLELVCKAFQQFLRKKTIRHRLQFPELNISFTLKRSLISIQKTTFV